MVLRFVFHGLTLWLFKNSETLLPLFHKAIATSFLALTIEEVALVRETKKPPEGGLSPSFSRDPRAYRFPFGLALAPSRRLKGCRAGYRASSLAATLDSYTIAF